MWRFHRRAVAAADFRLAPGGPGLGAGVFLTQVAGSGTSSRIVEIDSSSDGNGVTAGDTIELQGSKQTAVIVGIDRPSNALSQSAALTLTDGQGVALPCAGAASDIGSGAVAVQPSASKEGWHPALIAKPRLNRATACYARRSCIATPDTRFLRSADLPAAASRARYLQ